MSRFAETTRSSAMDGGPAMPTTTGHERIWVRRGICQPCNKTFTILPDWLAPSAPFSLRCREQACEHIAAGDSVEQAAPHCQDPSRSPDPSTLRRWAHRRLLSVCCWVTDRSHRPAPFTGTHHPCLGSGRTLPYSAFRGKKSMNRQALDDLKQQIPLMGYLQAHDWHPARPLSRGRWMGLCPLHGDHKPSFLVDANKDLFYCYGCGRGGDVIRFAELYHQVKFSQAVGAAAPMARCRAFVARSVTFLSRPVTPPQRGGCLSVPTWSPLPGVDRAYADRLRARRLPARLADAVGPFFAGSARGRPGDQHGLRRLRASDRLSAGRQSLWPQPFGVGTASPFFAGL